MVSLSHHAQGRCVLAAAGVLRDVFPQRFKFIADAILNLLVRNSYAPQTK
jgi:hypothetical protein